MCGITGYIGGKNAAKEIYEGLRRLEYRGYDSAGAAFTGGGKLTVIKREGKVEKLLPLLGETVSHVGIGHTRWATHGAPSDINAHPHVAGDIAVVHNGIIENYAKLKAGLVESGVKFLSDTDSEVIAHLINKYYSGDLLAALQKTAGLLEGSYAIMAICAGEDRIAVTCKKSPLIIGYGNGENYCASDEPALAGKCDEITVLEDGDFAELTSTSVNVYNGDFRRIMRGREPNLAVSVDLTMGDYPHYMLKEILEVPQSVVRTGTAFASVEEKLKDAFKDVDRVILTGCGTAYHAALVGKRYFESFLKMPAETETAGEFRYKNPVIGGRTAVLAISQSGETADTVEAARLARERGALVIAVTNSHRSQLVRLADVVVPVAAGPEICVAATKSYTGQIAALYLCAATLAGGELNEGKYRALSHVAALAEKVIKNSDVSTVANMCSRSRGTYFLGRDLDYALALEGSLKLKEVSYVPGEGYPAGELKHGPLALIYNRTVAVFIITDKELAVKCENAVEQVVTRGGKAVVITNVDGIVSKLPKKVKHVIRIPKADKYLSVILAAAVVQLLAYRTATVLNRDPDKPRNLAKSVTVE
ncbi:MAG: glutamine--fructose-6-phosphate transaminase (isomerizing) [Clostridia bacterium]|nr:glutamine--fructose-6-phosphate transaminase (isomerizing) [Clostridia bacterium]